MTTQTVTAGNTTALNTATRTSRRRHYVVAGLVAGLVAAVATSATAFLAQAAGVSLEVPEGKGSIPVLAFTQITFGFAVLGIPIAAAARRWSGRPARTWIRVTTALTALSLVPPFIVGADLATEVTLVVAHLVAAAIVIPPVAGRLDD